MCQMGIPDGPPDDEYQYLRRTARVNIPDDNSRDIYEESWGIPCEHVMWTIISPTDVPGGYLYPYREISSTDREKLGQGGKGSGVINCCLP